MEFNMATPGKGTTQDSAEEYHSQIAVLMSPVIVTMGIMMLVGFFGNILVIYIYAVRLKRSTTRLFITALAVADTVVCIVCIPVEIVVVRYLYSFDIPWLCRVFRTIVLACVTTSISVLISIAVDRYKRVCTPFKSQISVKRAKIAVGIGCIVAITLASPSMVILGRKTVNRTVVGYACATDDSMVKTPFPGLFNGMQLLIAVISISTLTTLYALILKRVRAQKRYREGMTPKVSPRKACSTQSGEATSVTDTVITSTRDSTLVSAQDNIATSDDTATSSRDNTVTSAHEGSLSCDDTITSNDDTTTSPINTNGKKVAKINSGLKNGTHKTTLMMFIITAVFILSFVPHLALMATRAVQKHTYAHLEGAPLALYNLFLRTYFINSVSNPIIYGFMSDKFRSQAKIVFRRMCCKK
ncbi:LOW QUALITY PROTEIN: neuropeptide S receptor-like [Haliotis rubra]|uniref:LOW QUALITY PROTEIN: neuropeptide S receptor-like n=1 Tax=Haliotis rubra TaxID=36100 RepID=UPI001EE52564|nr:LOW QUALITY PROTEIN: neuropeptide S receptor-like [Haliotis rubra]